MQQLFHLYFVVFPSLLHFLVRASGVSGTRPLPREPRPHFAFRLLSTFCFEHKRQGKGSCEKIKFQRKGQKKLSYIVSRPDISHFFSTNVLLGSIFLHMKARKLWQKLHKFCIYGNFFYITHILYVENFRFLHICHVETSEISPYVEKFSIHPKLSYMVS